MKRIDSRTVELSACEAMAVEHFEKLLDLGKGIPEAAREAIESHGQQEGNVEWIDPAFVAYLSEGYLYWDAVAKNIKEAQPQP